MTDANHAILLTGYSMTDITYIDPNTASQNTVSIEQMSAMIAGSGNTFIGYMNNRKRKKLFERIYSL